MSNSKRNIGIAIAVIAVGLVGVLTWRASVNNDGDYNGDQDIPVAEVASVRRIDADEGRRMINDDQSVILLDVRNWDEYAARHIGGAVLMPADEVAERADEELPNKDAVIIVYCATGNRSAYIAEMLVEMGYTNVFDMGGINAWPFDTISLDGRG